MPEQKDIDGSRVPIPRVKLASCDFGPAKFAALLDAFDSLLLSFVMSQTDSSPQSPTDYLKNATFSRTEGPSVSPDSAVTASDLLLAAYDPARLHPLAQIGDKLDYLLLDDEKTSDLPGGSTAVPSRGWSDDLCYGTGTMYLGGTLDLFHITTFDNTRLISSTNVAPYLSIFGDVPSLVFLLFSPVTCSPCFSRFGPWRRMGHT